MAIGRSRYHYSDFVFVEMREGSDMGTLLPIIDITSPADGAVYMLNQYVTADYSCSANASCFGTTDTGSPIDTSSLGMKAFDVVATVNSNNPNSEVSYIKSVSYNVEEGTYLFHLLYNPNREVMSGAVFPIKLQVLDINSNNISAPSVVLQAVDVIKFKSDGTPIATLNHAGNANPDDYFRFDPTLEGGGYIYNLSTRGLASGTYGITFEVSGDLTKYYAPFKVR